MADGGGFKGNDPALAARQRQMEKQRVKMMADFANGKQQRWLALIHGLLARTTPPQHTTAERERIARDSQVNVGSDKFVSQALDVEAELKRDTVGLVHLDEFQRIRGQLEEEKKRKEEEAAAASRKARIGGVAVKQKKKSMLQKGKLSFDDDLDGDDGNGFNNGNGDLDDGAMPAKKRRLKKDPTVDTSFLPDKDREEKERALRESLKQEWIDQQEAIKKEEIRVDVSYWDGSGHAGSVVCMKGDKIGHMLQKAKELYPQISRTAVDNLVFIKEDTILPHVCE